MINKKILFFLINMNLGGTEKSFLNLLNALPLDVEVDLLLLENEGQLLKQLPACVNLRIIEESESVNFLIQNSLLAYALFCFKKLDFMQMFRSIYFYIKSKFSSSSDYKFETIQKKLSLKPKIYDVAIAYAGPHQFISTYIAKKTHAKKKIQWIHFDIEKVINNFTFGKVLYPSYDQVFCVSKSSKEIFLKYFPQLKNKTAVFHNIVSKTELHKQAESGESFNDEFDGFRILTVGRFTQEKGQQLIPVVAEKLRKNRVNFRWYFVGEGKHKETVEKIAAELGISSNLVFLGAKQNPYPYMRDCDIYVQPSLHEGYGITVAEAQVFNKPIILTNFSSAKDLVQQNVTGIITDISSDGIYSALMKLIMDPALLKRISTKTEHSIEKQEDDQINLII